MANNTATALAGLRASEAAIVFLCQLPKIDPAKLSPEQRNGLARTLADIGTAIDDYHSRAVWADAQPKISTTKPNNHA
jgi:hypothetical protein